MANTQNPTDEFDRERSGLLDVVDRCSVQQAELHRLEWDNRKRGEEVRELQKALSDAQNFLFEERQRLMGLQARVGGRRRRSPAPPHLPRAAAASLEPPPSCVHRPPRQPLPAPTPTSTLGRPPPRSISHLQSTSQPLNTPLNPKFLNLQAENDELRLQEIEDRKKIGHLLAVSAPLQQEVTYDRAGLPSSVTVYPHSCVPRCPFLRPPLLKGGRGALWASERAAREERTPPEGAASRCCSRSRRRSACRA